MRNYFFLLLGLNLFLSCKKKTDGTTAPVSTLSIINFTPASGTSNTEVTITGNNFGSLPNYNLVTIGGFSTVPISASTTQLVFKIPASVAAGKFKISVKVGGVTATSSQDFEVTAGGSGFVSTAVVPITDAIVQACFDGVGKRDIHPRLLFTADDILSIKTSAASDPFSKANYEDVITRANNLLTSPILSYGLDGAGLRIPSIHTFSNNQLPYLVLAYQFTKDSRYALRCWQQLDAMRNWPDWGANRHFLDAGIAAKGVAIAYDGLYDYLSAAQRTQLSTAVRNFVLQPGKTQIETNTGVWRWYLSNDNWNGICHGGMIMAALATYETDVAFNSSVIRLATNGILPYMQSLGPDGASEEGMSYWSYGLTNTFLAFESLKRCLSTTYGLAEQPGFVKTGWFPYYMSGPVGTASIGDDYLYVGKSSKFLSYFWFSKYFKNPNLAKAHYDACLSINAADVIKMNGWLDLLFYDKTLVNSGSSSAFPLDGYLRGIEYMYLLENNNNDNALYVGMHGGDNNAAHGHLDAGSFFIQAQGETWAQGNLGLESPYPSDYFTTTAPSYTASSTNTALTRGRFYYYRVKTEGKNCLVFNPDARPEQNPTGVATLLSKANDGIGGYHIIDLSSIYNRDVTTYRRGIKLNRSNGFVTVQDEFTPNKNSTVYWLMHSPSTDGLVITANGKTATMIKNGKTFYAIIQSPSNAVFEKVDRSTSQINYLSETAPIFSSIMAGRNTPNQWYGKLQIKMTGLSASTPVTVRVDFVRSLNSTTPTLTALTGWTTSN
jgi:hypothetical protein